MCRHFQVVRNCCGLLNEAAATCLVRASCTALPARVFLHLRGANMHTSSSTVDQDGHCGSLPSVDRVLCSRGAAVQEWMLQKESLTRQAAAPQMSLTLRLASGSAKAVLYSAMLALGVWLLWYGQYQWGGYDCKEFRASGKHGPGWATNTPCALTWTKPVITSNLGFLVVAPAVAALAAVAVVGFRDLAHAQPACSRKQAAIALLQSLGSTQLPPKRFWLWLCDGLSAKDGLVIAAWAAYNAVWYSTILSKALAKAAHSPTGLSPRGIAATFASLLAPNLVPLLFPVSRGSAICNALGLSYPEGIRYHRWVGQWVLLLATCHGLIYWFSWVAMGTWLQAVARNGPDLSHLFGGLAFICGLLLWITSQEPVRRRFYNAYKILHHVGFWGFMVLGCAHKWTLFWYFVPGMLLYAVDGVFRLHQMAAGRGGSLTQAPGGADCAEPGLCGVNAEVLRVDVCPAGTMCSLLLAAPEFGAAPAGIVWLNVPEVSLTKWQPFDYTACEVTVSADGRVCNGFTADKAAVAGQRKVALSVHIKAYSRWTKTLVSRLAQGGQKLTVRVQGPYADPPVAIGQPDGVILVTGGNGIASALPVFEELSASGVSTQGLPALLVWACRKGHEFEFMAAPVLAAAKALGLNLTLQLHITDGADVMAAADQAPDTKPVKDQDRAWARAQKTNPMATTLAVESASSATSSESAGAEVATKAPAQPAAAAPAVGEYSIAAGPNSLCPVVAFASFAAQLSFKMVLHLAVFGGFLLGLFIATYIGGAMPVAAGQMPWPTCQLGPALVLIPAGCAVGLGLLTLWTGLLIKRLTGSSGQGLTTGKGPAAAIAASSGCLSQLLPVGKGAQAGGKGLADAPASLFLQVPSGCGSPEVLPVVASRPSVSSAMKGWLSTLQQLPGVSAAKDVTCSKPSGGLYCVVYGCGPTSLDHDTQLAVAAVAAKQKRRNGGGGSGQQVMLQFVRKAQML